MLDLPPVSSRTSLLRTPGERPRYRRAAECTKKLASPHDAGSKGAYS